MNFTLNQATGLSALFAIVFGVGTALFWMFVAWRAMRAHERLAAALERIALHSARNSAAAATRERPEQT